MRWMLLFLLLASCGIDDSNEEWLRLEAIKSEAVSERLREWDDTLPIGYVYHIHVCWKDEVFSCIGIGKPSEPIEECELCNEDSEVLYSGWREGRSNYDE